MSEPAPAKQRSSAAVVRRRTALAHRIVRFAVQIAFFILAPAAFSGAFSAVKYAFGQIGLAAPIEMTAFALLLLALLAFTVIFGRFFCGYACAFGTLGDVLHAIPRAICARTSLEWPAFPEKLVRVLSLLKYVVLAGICVACFLGAWSVVSGYSPWVAFAGLLSGSLEGVDAVAIAALVVVALGMVLRERFFCQFLCPLGAVFSLLPVLGISAYTRTRAHCARSCGKCYGECPVDIWPDADSIAHGECLACGRCADACPLNNVNLVALEKRSEEAPAAEDARSAEAVHPARPLRKTKETWRLVRGTGVAYTLLKAIALLVLFWALGTTRYLPLFGS